jgi:hypothetical protein
MLVPLDKKYVERALNIARVWQLEQQNEDGRVLENAYRGQTRLLSKARSALSTAIQIREKLRTQGRRGAALKEWEEIVAVLAEFE